MPKHLTEKLFCGALMEYDAEAGKLKEPLAPEEVERYRELGRKYPFGLKLCQGVDPEGNTLVGAMCQLYANPKFPIGDLTVTEEARETMELELQLVDALEGLPDRMELVTARTLLSTVLLARHVLGDWGDVCDEDAKANDEAVAGDARILSAYVLPATERKLWIITEADRSVTTILTPDEY